MKGTFGEGRPSSQGVVTASGGAVCRASARNQNRSVAMSHDTLGHTAKNQAAKPRDPARAHHDHVGPVPRGRRHDDGRRATLPDLDGGLDAVLGQDRCGRGEGALRLLALPGCERADVDRLVLEQLPGRQRWNVQSMKQEDIGALGVQFVTNDATAAVLSGDPSTASSARKRLGSTGAPGRTTSTSVWASAFTFCETDPRRNPC